jgi:hypothetical protein
MHSSYGEEEAEETYKQNKCEEVFGEDQSMEDEDPNTQRQQDLFQEENDEQEEELNEDR